MPNSDLSYRFNFFEQQLHENFLIKNKTDLQSQQYLRAPYSVPEPVEVGSSRMSFSAMNLNDFSNGIPIFRRSDQSINRLPDALLDSRTSLYSIGISPLWACVCVCNVS